MITGEPKNDISRLPSSTNPSAQERVVAAFKEELREKLPGVMDDVFADIDAAVAEAEGGEQLTRPDARAGTQRPEDVQLSSPLSSRDTLEQAEAWWANEGKGRELVERVIAIRASLDRFDVLIAQIRRFPQGEDVLSTALEAENPRVRPLTTDRVNAQLRYVLDQIEAGDLSRFQPKDGETDGKKPEQKRDAYLKANFLGHHVVLLAAERALEELRNRATETFPTQLAEAKTLIDEWFELHKKFVKRSNVEGIHRAVRKRLGIHGPLPDLEGWKAWVERHEQGAWAAGKGGKLKMQLQEEKLPRLRTLLSALRAELGVTSAEERGRPASVPKTSGAMPPGGPTPLPAAPASPDVPSALPAPPERKWKSLRDIAQVEKHLEMLKRKDEEIRYRDSMENLYLVRPTRNNEVFELWYPDKGKIIKHFREIAQEIYGLDLAFEGRGSQGGDASDAYYDPMLKDLSPDAIKQRGEGAEGVLRRKTGEARIELEKDLEAKLKLIAEQMNEMLLQEEPGLSYAKRRNRILAQLPDFAEMVLKLPKYVQIALSPDEQETLIEQHTQSITIQR